MGRVICTYFSGEGPIFFFLNKIGLNQLHDARRTFIWTLGVALLSAGLLVHNTFLYTTEYIDAGNVSVTSRPNCR